MPRNTDDNPIDPTNPELDGGDEGDSLELTDDVSAVIQQLQIERDEAVGAKLRALADFRNYQRRADESEKRALQSGAVRVVRSILPVLDHFDLALSQKPEQVTVPQLLQAVKIVRDEFNKALGAQGVERIEPVAGEPFDPHQHEAVMRQPSPGAAPNSVVSTMQSGFAMGDLVLRPAKVAVAPETDE